MPIRHLMELEGKSRKLGFPALPGLRTLGMPRPFTNFLYVSGITRDSSGAVLASCMVDLFRTADDTWLQSTVSDATGKYTFLPVNNGNGPYYIVAYKAGTVDKAGTSVNSLIGAIPIFQTGTYSTNFLATENPISEAGLWTNGSVAAWNDMQTTPNKCFGTQFIPSGFADNCAFLTGVAGLGNDYFIEGVVFRQAGYAPTTTHELELLIRGTVTPGAPGDIKTIEILMDTSNSSDLVSWNGPPSSFTTGLGTGSIGAFVDGTVIRVEVIGLNLVVKKDGVSVMVNTNPLPFATGVPGVATFTRGGDDVLANLGWRSISVGTL